MGGGVAASAVMSVSASAAAAVAVGSGASVAASTVRSAEACCALRICGGGESGGECGSEHGGGRGGERGGEGEGRARCRGGESSVEGGGECGGRGAAMRCGGSGSGGAGKCGGERSGKRCGEVGVACGMPLGQCGAFAAVAVQVRRGGGGAARCEVLDRDVCGRRVLRACDASCGRVRWAWCAGSASCVVAGPESGRGRQCRRFAGPPARPGGS